MKEDVEEGRICKKEPAKLFFYSLDSLPMFCWASWSISLYTQEFISCQRPFVKHFLYRIKNGLHTLTFLIDFVQSILCGLCIHHMINVSEQQPLLDSWQNRLCTEKWHWGWGFLHLANLHIFHGTYNFTWGKITMFWNNQKYLISLALGNVVKWDFRRDFRTL